ncbi:MAG: hypothetical protein NT038_02500 [Euryarchaeota archaeon]|nr:hypothetical protein [Euryarchaeota archaeon]
MEQKNYTEKIRSERGILEKIMNYIPGYRGYKEKELRRDSDRLVRTDVVNRLKIAKTALRHQFANPSQIEKLKTDDTYRLEAVNIRLDRVTQRIDRAVAGYSGMLASIKVKEDKLDMVIEHDLGLIEKADSIKTDVEKVTALIPGSAEWQTAMDAIITKVEELDKLIDERSWILRGLEE